MSKIAAVVFSDLAALVGRAVREPELLLLISSPVEQYCGGKTITQCLGILPAKVEKKLEEIYRFCLTDKKV